MQLLTKAADRLLSAVVPHVAARAGCLVCPQGWRTTAGCKCVKSHQQVKNCFRTGCNCQTIECGPCYSIGIACRPA
jgi:hypothetical protein